MPQSTPTAHRAARISIKAAAATALMALALVGSAQSATASTLIPNTVDFTVADVTNGYTTWTVPTGVTSITITALGANGGTSVNNTPGGLGAALQVVLAVTPGTVLTIAVGSVGDQSAGGVPGGGRGWGSDGGGGFSGVRLSDGTPMVIAGAGGGGGVYAGNGGNAGAAGGDDGGLGGQPGTNTAGGAGGAGAEYGNGYPGSAYQGGTGGGGLGAGGGGGYFGGGGGGANYGGGGGGGGSSFPFAGDASLIATALKTTTDPAEGRVTLEFDRLAYEVGFDPTDGVSAPALSGVYGGNLAPEPADPVRDGYTFGGWYTHPTAGELWDFSSVITSDLTLFARWVALPAAAPETGLADTGADILTPLTGGLGFAALGALLVLVSRTRRRPSVH